MPDPIRFEKSRESQSSDRRAQPSLFGLILMLFICVPQAEAAARTPTITSATTASGTAGSSFSYQIAATNAPTSYGAMGLPVGLELSAKTGLISGTAAAGASTVTLSATNRHGTGKAALSLNF